MTNTIEKKKRGYNLSTQEAKVTIHALRNRITTVISVTISAYEIALIKVLIG